MKVKSLLEAKGRTVITTRPYAPIMMVLRRMKLDTIGAMVVSPNGHSVIGMISERDIARGLAEHGSNLLTMRVADLMTRSVRMCSPEDDLRHVMAEMTRSRVRHLPVLHNGRLCGVLSIGDVVKCVLEEMTLEVNILRDINIASRSSAGTKFQF